MLIGIFFELEHSKIFFNVFIYSLENPSPASQIYI